MERISVTIGRVKGEDFGIRAQELVTGRTAVIAQSGAGKSWTIGVVCEQLCKSNIGFCIIDTEGEYFSLKEKFQLLWVGKDPACDLDIEGVDMGELVSAAMRKNVPVVFDVSEVMDERRTVAGIASQLYESATRLRVPYLMIIEEADKFVPQRGKPMREIGEISRRGRKRGLGLLLASQRPAFLNKDVLSQCDNQLLGKLTTEADLGAVNLFFTSRDELEELTTLRPGEFFVMGNIVSRKTKIHVIGRETTHKGFTPKLLPKPVGAISEIKELLGGQAPAAPIGPQALPQEVPGAPAVKTKLRGLSPKIGREKVTKIAEEKKRKRFALFGAKEMLMGIDLQFHPLILTEIKYTSGVIKKSIKTSSFLLDGVSGDLADIEKGFRLRRGFSKILGLDQNSARVLIEIDRLKRATSPDLEARTGLSQGLVRSAIKKLGDQKYITYEKVGGRTKVYVPLVRVNVPGLKHRVSLEIPKEEISGVKTQPKVAERDLREALKAIEPTSEVTKFEVFYYPFYTIRFRKRVVNIDGLTGKAV